MNEPPRFQHLAGRIYGALLGGYPGGFSQVVKREMTAAFHYRCNTAREQRGARGVAWILLRESLDLAWNAILEWSDVQTEGGEHPMDTLQQDLRYALRSVTRKPALAVISIAILALAIGGTTGIFTLIDRLLLAAPPGIEAPDELVGLALRREGSLRASFSHPDFAYFRDNVEAFSGVVASSGLLLDLRAAAEPERVRGQIVSGDFFSVLGVDLALGRGFLPEETKEAGGERVVVIGYSAWRDRFGGDPSVLGSTISLNGHPFTVVGVAPKGFQGFRTLEPAPEVWVPLSTQPVSMPVDWQPLDSRNDSWLSVAARLRTDTTREEAQAAIDLAVAQLTAAYSTDGEEDVGAILTSHFALSPFAREKITTILSLLMGVVLVVLVIACANLAGLFMTRAEARRRELGIRLALGSSRGRVLRLLLIESVFIALGGGLLGLMVSGWVVQLVVVISQQPLLVDARPDLTVLGFAVTVSVVTGLLFGLAPGLQASRRDVAGALLEGSGAVGSSHLRGRSLLVVGQVALSVVLLVGSALFVRSLQSLQSIDPGFDPAGLLLTSIDLRPQGLGVDETHALYRQFQEGLQALPGVRAASLVHVVPFTGHQRGGRFLVEGREPESGIGSFDTAYNIIGPDYFATLGVPLLRGRDFLFEDNASSPGVVIVNESFARMVWPGEDPIGKRITRGNPDGPWLEVVGVARDMKEYALTADPEPSFYRPILQRSESGATAVVRTAGAPETLIGPVREEVRRLNPDLPVYNVHIFDALLEASAAPFATNAVLTGLFGLLALGLSALGLYGLVAQSVVQRVREIGIRMALGAEASSVVRLMVHRGVVLVSTGLVLGIALAGLATRFIAGMLYAVSPADPTSFAMAAAVLVAAALLACYLPARQASRVEPVDALRAE